VNPNVPLRQNREGSYLSEQKNMAAGDAVRGAGWALEKVLAGATGPAEIVEGKHGIVKQLTGPLAPEAFTGLGDRFYIAETYIKQHMMEYHGQTIVDHALALRKQLGTPKLDDIESVHIKGYEAHATIIGDDSKRTPTTKETADHSLYYAFAAPMLEGQCMLEQYRDELLVHPGVRALIARTTFEEVPAWTQQYYAPSEVREFRSSAAVKLRDGREASHEEAWPHGHPKNPMSDAELEGKFFALGDAFLLNGRMVLDTFWDLENVTNVADAMATIVVGGDARLA
jgi:2-methylcitrate dehydratase